MKISILVFKLASNSIVRVYPIAKVLQRHFEIEIIGSYRGTQVFAPYRQEFEFKAFRYQNTLEFLTEVWPAMHRAITGDVIYAFKPRLTSYGIALCNKLLTKRPVVLDIEDWEMAQYLDGDLDRKLRGLVRVWQPDNLFTTWLMEAMVPMADGVIVVSTFLQEKFGGIRVVHGADTDIFDPKLYDQEALRRKWHVPTGAFVVLFAGKPFPHKGVVQIAQALRRLRDSSRPSMLLVVGGDRNDPYVQEVIEEGGEMVVHLGYQPHDLMPELLAISDCVALPQMPSPYSQAQVPGKVFEALAMGKPIVASRMSDLPEIIDTCGIVFEPGDIHGLSDALRLLSESQQLYMKFSRNARVKSESLYSWNAMEESLLKVFQSIHVSHGQSLHGA